LTPSEAAERYPFLFEKLSDEQIRDLLEYYRIGPIDVFGRLPELLQDTAAPLPPEEAVFHEVVDFLRALVRAECKQRGRESVADEADRIVGGIYEAAHHGKTRGEQRAAILYRHPETDPDIGMQVVKDGHDFNLLPPDARKLRARRGLLPALRMVREFEELRAEFKKRLGNKPRRKKARDKLYKELRQDFPELSQVLKDPQDVVALTPELAARIVWGKRRHPDLSEDRLSHLLAEAREVIEVNEDLSPFLSELVAPPSGDDPDPKS
jgi:hypothetical protein